MDQEQNDFPEITYLKLALLFTPLILKDLEKESATKTKEAEE